MINTGMANQKKMKSGNNGNKKTPKNPHSNKNPIVQHEKNEKSTDVAKEESETTTDVAKEESEITTDVVKEESEGTLDVVKEEDEETYVDLLLNNLNKPKGGRPRLDAKDHRKQYTLTLQSETHDLIMAYAKSEIPKLSFAAFMERAALEYIKNNY